MASDHALEISEVSNSGWDARIRIFRCGSVVDCFAVITDRFVVIVDTLIGRDSISVVLDTLGPELSQRTLLAINTHGDWDHVWGNGLFAGPDASHPASIFGHHSTAEAIQSTRSRELLERFQRENPSAYATASWVTPNILFDGDLSIDGGDLQLDLISTPGHTADHLSIWIPAIRTLLAGDAVECPLPYVNAPGDLPTLRSTLRRLHDLDPTRAVFSCAGRDRARPHRLESRILRRVGAALPGAVSVTSRSN